jgi:pimeloyl-ACP methyl ester carboxylesterase
LRLSDHIDDNFQPILAHDLTDVVLVGHSYGGLVIAGVAERIPMRLRHLVYVDALAPRMASRRWTSRRPRDATKSWSWLGRAAACGCRRGTPDRVVPRAIRWPR